MSKKPDDVLPPWEQPGWARREQPEWVPRPPVPGEPGLNDPPTPEELARVRARIAEAPRYFRVIKVTPNREKLASMTKLKAARKRVKELGGAVRDEAFGDWLSKCVVIAQRPDEWTQAAVLYASYIRHASRYGNNRGDKALAKEELATETSWGKLMGAAYPNKKRRARGWYYPVRPKRGV